MLLALPWSMDVRANRLTRRRWPGVPCVGGAAWLLRPEVIFQAGPAAAQTESAEQQARLQAVGDKRVTKRALAVFASVRC